tara:strand:+ start:168792 stop:169271 length:480 start_codon:yes stop_codon:yes gene_type:complete
VKFDSDFGKLQPMKRKFSNATLQKLFAAFLLICSGLVTLQAKELDIRENSHLENNVPVNKNDVVGRWLYTIADVAYEYSRGALYISEENGVYIVEVHVNNDTIHGQNIKVAQNKITFDLQIEGSKVGVTLRAVGDKLSGESSSSEGVFKIEGKRKAQPQ